MKSFELNLENYIIFEQSEDCLDTNHSLFRAMERIEKCKPILITEDWLIGFEFFAHSKDKYTLILRDDNDLLSLFITARPISIIDGITYFTLNLMLGFDIIISNITEVHKLQNIYALFVGKPLERKY